MKLPHQDIIIIKSLLYTQLQTGLGLLVPVGGYGNYKAGRMLFHPVFKGEVRKLGSKGT